MAQPTSIYEQEHEDFRAMARTFMEKEVAPHMEQWEKDGQVSRELWLKAGEQGLLCFDVPEEFGGMGVDDFRYNAIVSEELSRIGASGPGFPVHTDIIVPYITSLGTDEQKQRWLPGLVSGELISAIAMTEPGAGSDLQGVKTSAVDKGDHYVLNGSKTFISNGIMSDVVIVVCRTDPDAPRHRGISIFLIPMDTPGITVRPLWTIQSDPPAPPGTTYGMVRTNETFFENVRIPASCMLGEENGGWYVGAMGLNLDRVGASRYLISVRRDEDIVNWVKENDFGGHSPAEDPAVRDKLAELWTEAQVCRLMTMRSMSLVNRGGNFTYEGSAEKVWAPEHGVKTTEAISQILGPYAQLLNGSEEAIEDGLYAHNLMGSFQSGINHGSVQIMRDQMARRGLGMPRG